MTVKSEKIEKNYQDAKIYAKLFNRANFGPSFAYHKTEL